MPFVAYDLVQENKLGLTGILEKINELKISNLNLKVKKIINKSEVEFAYDIDKVTKTSIVTISKFTPPSLAAQAEVDSVVSKFIAAQLSGEFSTPVTANTSPSSTIITDEKQFADAINVEGNTSITISSGTWPTITESVEIRVKEISVGNDTTDSTVTLEVSKKGAISKEFTITLISELKADAESISSAIQTLNTTVGLGGSYSQAISNIVGGQVITSVSEIEALIPGSTIHGTFPTSDFQALGVTIKIKSVTNATAVAGEISTITLEISKGSATASDMSFNIGYVAPSTKTDDEKVADAKTAFANSGLKLGFAGVLNQASPNNPTPITTAGELSRSIQNSSGATYVGVEAGTFPNTSALDGVSVKLLSITSASSTNTDGESILELSIGGSVDTVSIPVIYSKNFSDDVQDVNDTFDAFTQAGIAGTFDGTITRVVPDPNVEITSLNDLKTQIENAGATSVTLNGVWPWVIPQGVKIILHRIYDGSATKEARIRIVIEKGDIRPLHNFEFNISHI